MNIGHVKQLVHAGESETLEFKKSSASLKAASETICAFLNGKGGIVLIGVADNKHILGQHVTDNTKQDLANALRKFEPTANIETHYISAEKNKQVIALVAHPDSHMLPYTFDGKAYERKQSTTHVMSQNRYQQMLLARNHKPFSWESQPATHVTVQDLDQNEILRTIADGIKNKRIDILADTQDPIEALTQLSLMQAGQLVNAAVVLFCNKMPGEYFQCVIKMARFRGIEKSKDFIDSKHVMGHAFHLLREAESFIGRHTSIRSLFTEGELARVDKPEYPSEAIRESLINAICHRDYASPGGSVTLLIYDDRLEISNLGILPKELSIEDLRKRHISIPRNKMICDVFYRRGFIESFGIGTQQMIKVCREAATPEPEFSEQGGVFTVCFRSPDYIKDQNRIQQQLLTLLETHGELALKQLVDFLAPNTSLRNTRHELYRLKELGLIDAVGHGRGAKWRRTTK